MLTHKIHNRKKKITHKMRLQSQLVYEVQIQFETPQAIGIIIR